jgi:molybdopterin molybdotransferase
MRAHPAALQLPLEDIRMLDFARAQTLLAEAAQSPTRSQTVPLGEAYGRVLATSLDTMLDVPPADHSAMDGYALRHADYRDGVALPIQQRCYAGDMPAPQVAGQATRLFTGNLIPAGADTVVMQEDTEEVDGAVRFLVPPVAGRHIRRRGEDRPAGTPLLVAGTRLNAAHVALLASQGLAQVPVYPALRVGILTTGDELVLPGQPRAEPQIYNSNGPMLGALVQGLGVSAPRILHAADNAPALREAFEDLLASCDLVISVGGVSVGDRDLVRPVLESLGASLDLWKVRMKPGKPVALARVNDTPVVCLPGNPGSAFTVFALMVSPLVRRMQGRTDLFPLVSRLPLRTDKPLQDSREILLRVQPVAQDDGSVVLISRGHQGSGAIGAMTQAPGLARLPADETVHDGDAVAYYDLQYWLA